MALGSRGGGNPVALRDGWRFLRGDCPAEGKSYRCADVEYDDGEWRPLRSVPHDWSIEDLPPREHDAVAPVLGVRYGHWRLRAGDEPEWANASYDDSGWKIAAGGADWRAYGPEFRAANATGWYRQHFGAPDSLVQRRDGAAVLLSVGVVAGACDVFVNGRRVGGSASELPTIRDYVTPVAVPLPPGLLVRGARANVVALRVRSFGGAAPGPPMRANGSFAGGLYDDPALGNHDDRVGPFDPAASPGGSQQAHTLAGVGWYRLVLPPALLAGIPRIAVRFDGVYMRSDVYLDGQHVLNHPYGYTPFEVTLPPGARVLAVRVNASGVTSRWYAGAGLIRSVYLLRRDPVHIAPMGIQISTPEVVLGVGDARAASATATANVTVVNSGPAATLVRVTLAIRGPNGATVGTRVAQATVVPGARQLVAVALPLHRPPLWGVETPLLHTAAVNVTGDDGSADGAEVRFGVRAVSFDAVHGLRLNGLTTNMWGGCVHHGNGPLGGVAIGRADERRVEQLKRHGYNAVRTAHNPPSTAFLDACDRLGMLVIDEAFDCWAQGKNPDDYHLDFAEWWERDLTAMVLRDRNHPSVVMWSIGNEIPMRFTRQGANLSVVMRDMVHELDWSSGRAVTSAYPLIHDQDSAFLDALDVPGYNYAGVGVYEADHKRLPKRTMVGTESVAADSFRMHGYVSNMSWVVGDFIWTAIDYLGDDYFSSTSGDVDYLSGRRPFPWHASNCGDLDGVLHQRPQSLYRAVLWGAAQIGLVVHQPSANGTLSIPGLPETMSWWGWPDELERWSWPGFEGAPLQVRVFVRGCQTVQLELDGAVLARAPVQANLTAVFVVPYTPGRLEAICANGSIPLPGPRASLSTEGAPVRLQLEADRTAIAADRDDLAYITATLVDAEGTRVQTLRPSVTFHVAGVGELLAVGTGDPADPASFQNGTRRLWQGRAVAIAGPSREATSGQHMIITASIQGVPTASVVVILTA